MRGRGSLENRQRPSAVVRLGPGDDTVLFAIEFNEIPRICLCLLCVHFAVGCTTLSVGLSVSRACSQTLYCYNSIGKRYGKVCYVA